MKSNKFRLGLSTVAITGMVFFSATPLALASDAGSGGSPTTSGTVSGSTTVTTTSPPTSDPEAQTPLPNKTQVEDRVQLAQSAAKEKLSELRADQAAKTSQERHKACTEHKAAITHKLTAYNAAASDKLTHLNSIFTRVKQFKTDTAQRVTNYDALVATATAKQTTATDAVAALKLVSANFDCSVADPATNVAAIKAATSDARSALKAYRQAIKDIVVALAQVNTPADTSATTTKGSN